MGGMRSEITILPRPKIVFCLGYVMGKLWNFENVHRRLHTKTSFPMLIQTDNLQILKQIDLGENDIVVSSRQREVCEPMRLPCLDQKSFLARDTSPENLGVLKMFIWLKYDSPYPTC